MRADIDFGFAEALTTFGIIGVKCWIYRGEILDPNASMARGTTTDPINEVKVEPEHADADAEDLTETTETTEVAEEIRR